MGKYTVVLSLGLAFLVSVTADADVLKLANGGDLKGSVHQVTFLSGGKQTVYASERLERLWVSEVGKDRLTLKDGTSLEGELISLKFRSVGGLLTFRRKEVKAVELGDTALDQVRKEFAARKAKVKPDDAGGLLELAEWARAKGLKPEALELARTCLEAAKGDVAQIWSMRQPTLRSMGFLTR